MFKATFTALLLAAGLTVAAVPALAGGQPFGSATGGINLSGGQHISFSVKDGNPVGTEGRSADTAGDRGHVAYRSGSVHFTADVICAAYITPRGVDSDDQHAGYKMRFAYQEPNGSYTVVRVVDRGSPGRNGDTYASGHASSFSDAVAWCNRGARGSGHTFGEWTFYAITAGNIVVH